MENSKSLQQQFFDAVKTKLDPGNSLVAELAEVLALSTDSAYRRIRGETPLTIDEIATLSRNYNLSVDSILTNSKSSIAFEYHAIGEEGLTLHMYLEGIYQDLIRIASAEDKEIVYFAKDLPLFHFFHYPEIARFKFFFWMRTVYQFPEYEKMPFGIGNLNPETAKLCQKILNAYSRIPTLEVWSDETMNSTLTQIRYCWESGIFSNKSDAETLCDLLSGLVDHLESQAERGAKFIPGLEPTGGNDNYRLFFNEILLPDNTILVRMGEAKIAYLPRNLLNFLVTSNHDFASQMWEAIQKIVKKSQLVSVVAEKDRSRIFRKFHQRIDELKKSLT